MLLSHVNTQMTKIQYCLLYISNFCFAFYAETLNKKRTNCNNYSVGRGIITGRKFILLVNVNEREKKVHYTCFNWLQLMHFSPTVACSAT